MSLKVENMPLPQAPATAPLERAGSYAYYVLGILVLVYILNFIDRNVIAILLEPIKHELQVSDTAMGLLTGFGFTFFYAVLAIPIARYADRANRRNLLALAIAFWSACTTLCGLTQSYMQLLMGRIGVGIGEAGGTAPAYSIISDYFPRRQRAWAMGIYSAAIYIGVMLSLFLGSLLAERYGWRAAFLILGPPGLLIALLVRFTVAEPVRGRFDQTATVSGGSASDVFSLLRTNRPYLLVIAGLTVMSITLGGYAAWAPTFLIRVHSMSLSQAGVVFGLVLGVFGAIGALSGGWLCDKLSEHKPAMSLRFPAVACMLTMPAFTIFCFVDTPGIAMTAYAAAMIVSGMHFGPAFALTQNLVPSEIRSSSAAIGMLATTVGGQGVGPLLAGVLNDAFASDHQQLAIRYSLVILAAFSLLAGFLFWLGARYMDAIPEDATTRRRPVPA